MNLIPFPAGRVACDEHALLSIDDALGVALSQVAPLGGVEVVRLLRARGRVAARDVAAPVAMPFFANAAMDGFAVRAGDLAGALPVTLPIAGTVSAGMTRVPALAPGTVLKIFTGAALPAGADAVVAVEGARHDAASATFLQPARPGENVRPAGAEQPQGALLLRRGTPVAPHHIGLLAANGIGRVEVVERPRVAVFSTGDELVARGRRHGQIFDSNRPALLALAEAHGADVADLGVIRDDPRPRRRGHRRRAGRGLARIRRRRQHLPPRRSRGAVVLALLRAADRARSLAGGSRTLKPARSGRAKAPAWLMPG